MTAFYIACALAFAPLFWLAVWAPFLLATRRYRHMIWRLRPAFALHLDPNVTHIRPRHGPQTWPFRRLLVIRAFRTNPDLPRNPAVDSWNVWAYTRWGAWCWLFSIDRRTPAQRGGV